jgi:NitT/TauT family transport system ATP-binding protein
MNEARRAQGGRIDAGSARRTHVTVRGLTKTFGASRLYDGFDLDIARGRVTTVFGPNGCGKSTLIGMLSGIAPFDAGDVSYDGQSIKNTRIGYVFQNYRDVLFPWLTALENIRYPLRFMPITEQKKHALVERILAQVDVGIDLGRYPYQLSGGQQQVVSIMRALVVQPEFLFLDEPFSALDYEMSLFMRDLLQRIHMETGITMMMVSHDLEDAIYLADHVLLLRKHPTRVSATLDVDCPWPRSLDTLATPEFIAVKQQALKIFQQDVAADFRSRAHV